jgi:hypothetical protein
MMMMMIMIMPEAGISMPRETGQARLENRKAGRWKSEKGKTMQSASQPASQPASQSVSQSVSQGRSLNLSKP